MPEAMCLPLLMATLAALVSGPEGTAPAAEFRLEAALRRIDESLEQSGARSGPGCVYAAAKEGQPPFIRARGFADLEHDAAISATTVFDAGSVAKQVTAAAVLLLVEEGKLHLADDIRKHLPEMPDYGAPITIRHLLNHTSGLRDWMVVEQMAGRPLRTYDNGDILEIAARQRSLNHRPGARWSYTNTGYILLAIIVRRVSGSSLADFTRQRIFAPLEMHSTQWTDYYRRVVENRATGYRKADRRAFGSDFVRTFPMETGDQYGSGGLLTTAGDLLLWNEALDRARLGDFVTSELQRPTVLSDGRIVDYAAGLHVMTWNGHRWIWHGGGIPGFKSTVERFPDARVSIVVLCNSDEADHRLISRELASALLPPSGQERPSAAAPADSPLSPLEAHTGTFIVEQTGLPVMITKTADRLLVDGVPMERVGPAHYRASPPWGTLVFTTQDVAERNITTEVDGLQTLRRIKGKLAAESQLAEFTGRYVSDEADSAYDVLVEGGTLVLKSPHRIRVGLFGPTTAWTPLGADVFQADPTLVIRFNRSADGKVTSFDMSTPRVRAMRFHRRGSELHSSLSPLTVGRNPVGSTLVEKVKSEAPTPPDILVGSCN